MLSSDSREVIAEHEYRDAFPILVQLRAPSPSSPRSNCSRRYARRGTASSRYVAGDSVAVAGVTIATNVSLGRHASVSDLATDEDERSEGHGRRLLEFVHEWAAENGCDAVELESGQWRADAHRFYTERMGDEEYCTAFVYDRS